MSDQTYEAEGPSKIDGSKLINVPAVVGIITINGDATAAQTISAASPGFVSSVGPLHVVNFPVFAPAVPGPSEAGLVPNPGAAGATDYLAADATFKPIPVPPPPGITQLEDDGGGLTFAGVIILEPRVEGLFTPGVFQGLVVGPNQFQLALRNFLGTHGGLVTAPGVAGITDYLGADNTFRPIPKGATGLQTGADPGTLLTIGLYTVVATVVAAATGFVMIEGVVAFTPTAVAMIRVRIAINGTPQITTAVADTTGAGVDPNLVAGQAVYLAQVTAGDIITLVADCNDTGAPTTLANPDALKVLTFS